MTADAKIAMMSLRDVSWPGKFLQLDVQLHAEFNTIWPVLLTQIYMTSFGVKKHSILPAAPTQLRSGGPFANASAN
jgi:hypothetical protein